MLYGIGENCGKEKMQSSLIHSD